MIVLILFKWSLDWSNSTISPPSLIQTMIKMFLSPGKVDPQHLLYYHQDKLQLAFLIIALLSIPWMLFPKPIIHNIRFKRAARKYSPITEQTEEDVVAGDFRTDERPLKVAVPTGAHISVSPGQREREDSDTSDTKEHKAGLISGKIEERNEQKSPPAHSSSQGGGGGGGHGHGEAYSFSDDFIHTCIHTIEYVLGTVSNTASYLRLWALSLAHSELATVFWDKIFIEYGVQSMNIGLIFVCWAIWAGATFCVLLCMDVLECFLHALRLHWVEFQNKFYLADGYSFEPFTFGKSINDD